MKSRQNIIIKHANGKEYDLHELGFWVSSFHIHAPNLSRTLRQRKNRSTIRETQHNERPITLTGNIESDYMVDYENQKELLYTIFATEEEFEIIREIRPDRRIFAVLDGSYDVDNLTDTDGEFSLDLTMYNPFLYGHSKTFNLNNTLQTVEIGGVQDINWTSETRFTVPQSSFEISNNRGGKVLLNHNFIAGDVLRIDHLKRQATLNGSSLATAIRIESNWDKMTIKPGIESLKSSQPTVLSYAEKFFY